MSENSGTNTLMCFSFTSLNHSYNINYHICSKHNEMDYELSSFESIHWFDYNCI
jgi:hypothetical protein